MVYRNAVRALPTDISLRSRLIDVLRPFEFPSKSKMVEEIYASIERDFGDQEEAWDLRARRHVSGADASTSASVT